MAARRPTALFFGGSFLILAAGAEAQQQPSRPPIHLEISNWRLTRNVSFIVAAAQVTNRVSDQLLSRGIGDRLQSRLAQTMFRATKLYVVDLPLVAISHSLSHEAGHLARLQEGNIDHQGMRVDRWPWPVPIMDISIASRPTDDVRWLTQVAAGDEVGHVRDAIANADRSTLAIDYFQAAQLIYSRLETPVAAWKYLPDSSLESPPAFLLGRDASKDPRYYVLTYEFIRGNGKASFPSIQNTARRVRSGSLLSLIDLELWGSVTTVGRYLLTGEATRTLPSLRVLNARVLPRATFDLTPRGLARGGAAVVLGTNLAYEVKLACTNPPLGKALWDGSVRVSSHSGNSHFDHINVAVWQDTDASLGGSVAGGVAWRLAALDRTKVGVELGYKTSGFLPGAPLRASWSLMASFTYQPKR